MYASLFSRALIAVCTRADSGSLRLVRVGSIGPADATATQSVSARSLSLLTRTVFTQIHGLSSGLAGLCFLPIPIGATIAFGASVVYYQPLYKRRCGTVPVAPEHRLYEAMIGVPALVVAGVRGLAPRAR